MASDKGQLAQLKDFLTHIASFKGDLSNITAPPFVLAQKSATEFPASWAAHQGLFLAQGASPDPQQRALAVLKNFLCSLKTQTYTGSSEKDGAKKPLNAFLGELFIADFEGDTANTRLISEQVSHHPPVTACFLFNEKHGISAEGYVAQETTFSPSQGVTVNQVGHAIIHIAEYDEHHMITLPTLKVKNILSGSPYPELAGTCYITSSSGFTSKIEFEGKKLLGLSGTKNSLTAQLYHNDNPSKPVYDVSGAWNTELTIHDCAAQKDMETLNIDQLVTTPMTVAPRDQQDPWESRRAWGPVLDAIAAGSVKDVSEEKTKIEEAQRQLRKQEEKQGSHWPRKFFVRVKSDSMSSKLASAVGEPLNEDRTDGIWKFCGLDKAKEIQKPYHPDLTPTGPVQ